MKFPNYIFALLCLSNLLVFNGNAQSNNFNSAYASLYWTDVNYPDPSQNVYGAGLFENVTFPGNNSFDLLYNFEDFGRLEGPYANNIDGVLSCDFTDEFLGVGYPMQNIPCLRVSCAHNESSDFTFDFYGPTDQFDLIIFDIDNTDQISIEATYQGNTITDFSDLPFFQGDLMNPNDADIANWNASAAQLTSSVNLPQARNYLVLRFEDFPIDELKVTFQGGTPASYLPHFYMSLFNTSLVNSIPSLCEGDNLFLANTYKQWHTGGGGGLVFNENGVATFEQMGINSNFPNLEIESGATYCDPITGEVLIYSDGLTAWRGDGSVIPTINGESIFNNISGFTHGAAGSPLIVAPPGQCANPDSLYIFFTDDESRQLEDADGETNTDRNPELYYVIVNLAENEISAPYQLTSYPTSEQINAVQVNCDSIWLVYRASVSNPGSKGNSIYAHLWTSQGISTDTVITPNIYIGDDYRYRSAFSLDGNRFAATSAFADGGLGQGILLCDFNQLTGQFSDPIYLYDEFPDSTFSNYGIAFSPDHSKLYVTNKGHIVQYDVTGNSQIDIQNSRINISNGGGHGGLQNGPDGKIYVAKGTGTGGTIHPISVIHSPNQNGSACNYELNAISTGGFTTSGLQNIVYGKGPAACLPHINEFEVLSDCQLQISLNECYPGSSGPYSLLVYENGNLIDEIVNLIPNENNVMNVPHPAGGTYDFQLVDGVNNPGPIVYKVLITPSTPIVTTLYEAIVEGDCFEFFDTDLCTEDTYEETLIAYNGCDSIVELVLTVTPLEDLQVEVEIQDASCNADDGWITTFVTGGLAPYTYLWSNGATTPNISNLSADDYSLVVTDALGESVNIETITLDYDSEFVTEFKTICEGETYWIGGDPYTEEGEYSGTGVDGDNCAFDYILYLEVSEWNTTGIVKTDADCGQNNGSITTNPSSDGGGLYQYNWSTGANTPTIENLSPGIYYLTVIDAKGCSIVDSVTINNLAVAPTNISASICNGACFEVGDTSICDEGVHTIITSNATGTCDSVIYLDLEMATFGLQVELDPSQTNNFCMQDDDGFINSVVIGGTEPYAYTWTNELGEQVANTANLSAVPAGEYTLLVTDAYDCSSSNSLSLESISLDTFWVNTSICAGASYELNGVYYDQEGTYDTLITSQNGCDSFVHLTLSLEGITFSVNTNDASCGGSNGSIDLTINNQSNYSFLWSTGEEVADIENLSMGTYSLTITDSGNGCTTSASYLIENQPVDTTYLSVQFCPDSCYLVGNTPLCAPGIQEVLLQTVTDACDSLVVVNLSLEPPLSLALTPTSENCGTGDGVILSNVSGGILPYTYSWTDANGLVLGTDSTLYNIGEGLYTLEVKDSLGCVSTLTTVLESIDFNAVYIETTLCQGDSFELNGDYKKQAGTYVVTMANSYDCDSTVTLVLDFSSFNFDIISTNAVCGNNNGEASVAISNPTAYQYAWDNDAWDTVKIDPQIQNLSTGIYFVSVTNFANACVQTDSVVIDYQPVDTSFIALICPDSCYTIGDTILCEPGQHTIVLQTEEYSCDSIIDLNLFLGMPLSISFDSTQTEYYCMQSEGEITTTVSGGFSPYLYLWTDANGIVVDSTSNPTGLSEGTYTVQVTDSIGCMLFDSITLISQTSFVFVVDTMICAGECYELDSVYYCVNGTNVIDTLKSFNDCDSIVILTLKVYGIDFDLDFLDSGCGEDNGTISVINISSNDSNYGNPFNIVWNSPDWNSSRQGASIDSLSPGMYYVTVRNLDAFNEMGCVNQDSALIEYKPVDSTFVERCLGDCYTINNIEYCEPGHYRDTLEGYLGCDSIVDLRIRELFIPEQHQMEVYIRNCYSDVELTGYLPSTGNATGYWSSSDPDIQFEDSLSNPTWAYNLKKGENFVFWNIIDGPCSFVRTYLVFYEGAPIAIDDHFELKFNADTTLNLTANDDLFYSPNLVNLSVDNDSTIVLNDSLVSFKAPREFFGELEFQYVICNAVCAPALCSDDLCPDFCDTATVKIRVLPYETDSPFPDIITPNGDGFNDTWVVDPLVINPEDYPDNELIIFNRWGGRVFHAKPYNNDWGGTNKRNGAPLPESTYYYILYLDVGKGEVYNGQILVNR